jgi:hypothetical protein
LPLRAAGVPCGAMVAGIQIAVRLDPELLARIDAIAPKLSTEAHEASRSDVIRALVKRALPLYEESEPEHKPRKPR